MNSRIFTSVVSLVIATVSTTTANPSAADDVPCTFTPENVSVTIDLAGNAVPETETLTFSFLPTYYNLIESHYLSVNNGPMYGVVGDWVSLAALPPTEEIDYSDLFESATSEFSIVPQVGDVIEVIRAIEDEPTTGQFTTACMRTITYTVIPTPPPPRPELGRCWDSLEIWMSCRTPAALPQTV